MLVAPERVQRGLLAVLAEPALGEVDQLRPRLGVLHLDDVDVRRVRRRPSRTPRAPRRPSARARSRAASDGLKTSNVPARRVRKTAERSQTGPRLGKPREVLAPAEHERRRPFARRAEHVLGERVREHRRGEDLVDGERPAAPGVRRQRAVRERLRRDLRERLDGDRVVVHVALQLGAEELRRHHQPDPRRTSRAATSRRDRSGRRRAGACRSPTTSATSAAPDSSARTAATSDEPPVAQPFLTLTNGRPVGPRSATIVSALPASSLPP